MYLFQYLYLWKNEIFVPLCVLQTCNASRALSPNHFNSAGSSCTSEIQTTLESLGIVVIHCTGSGFYPPQLRNKIGVVEIRYVLALGAFSLHIDRGRRCGGGWLAQRPFLGWLLPTRVPRHRHMKKCLFWQKRGLCPCLMSWWHFRDLHRGYEFHTYRVQIRTSSTLVETWRTTMTTATRRNAQVETHPSLGGLRIQPWELDSLGLAPIFGPQTIVKL